LPIYKAPLNLGFTEKNYDKNDTPKDNIVALQNIH